MPNLLSKVAGYVLWPLGFRRRQRAAPQDPSREGPAPENEAEDWELDLCQLVGSATGALLAWWAFSKLRCGPGTWPVEPPRLPLSTFLALLQAGAVTSVIYTSDKQPAGSFLLTASLPAVLRVAPNLVSLKAGGDATVAADMATIDCETLLLPGSHKSIFKQLLQSNGLTFECAEGPQFQEGDVISTAMDVSCLLVAIAALYYVFYGSTGSGSSGKFSAKHLEDNKSGDARPVVTFDDVAGMEDTKEELREVIAFLRNPQGFYALGARPPRGLLLAGPSGTGKTLLARAMAGEAGVPFLYASSASFVEIFVGTGAQRIRQFFEHARSCAPCIVFLDELDAVGAARQAGASGGHQEYCQTLNQLLLELDGVESHSSSTELSPLVVTIAATNRYDCLDEALVRPGRLDRIVMVGLPGFVERVATLRIHARRLRSEGLDFEELARRTEGRSGADLANLLNEAALLAARGAATAVGMKHVLLVLEKPRPEQRPSRTQRPGVWADDVAGADDFLNVSRTMAGAFAAAAAMASSAGAGCPPASSTPRPQATEVD